MAPGYQPLKQLESDPDDERRSSKSSSKSRFALVSLLILGAFGLSALWRYRTHETSKSRDTNPSLDDDSTLKQCPAPIAPAASPPAPLNLWASLTVPEITSIQHWLESPTQNLNLTRGTGASLSDNQIYLIEAFRPPKSSALAYLSSPNTTSPPERYARVTVHHGAAVPKPVIKDYVVGPLPVGRKTQMRELTEIYHRDEIPYNARGYARLMDFQDLLMDFISTPELAEAMEDLFGGSATGQANDTLVAGGSAPFGIDGSFRRLWVTWRRNTAGPWLHPIGFFQYIDISGTDMSQWKILKIVYNHQIFPSLDSFLSAYRNGTLKRLPPRPDQQSDLAWSSRVRSPNATQLDLDHLPGPRSVSFAGLRYRVDKARQYVSWMGWGMYLGFDRDMGLSLWDVRFRGEMIIYELAPQEAIAQYAGNDPLQSTTAWLDRFFGMGQNARDLLAGYDCPYEATYLPATTHSPTGPTTRDKAICVFEHDTGRPLTRHFGWTSGEMGAVRGYTMVVRMISTVGNYDYLFDYIFHLDGTVEVRLSASGYLQGAFWEPMQEGYGTTIRDTTMGSLHDHVINYKVDLDVAGTENSLLHTSTSQEEVTQPWFDEDWGSTVIQQKITREYIDNEDQAMLKFPSNFQGGYALVNKEETNKWGVPRGYSVHPGYSPVHNTVVGSKRLLNNANWARYNLAVSRRKETEPTSSSMWNLHLPGAPMVDFHKFFDGENITQEDLVAWVNVGMHHLPQAEDAPNTRTNTATSSFFLTPLNYFDSDVSLDSINAILLDPEDGFTHNDYGVQPAHCVPPAPAPFRYSVDGLKRFDLDGNPVPLGEIDLEQRRGQGEMYHWIKVGAQDESV